MIARRTGWLFCDPDAERRGGFPLQVIATTYVTAGRAVPLRLADELRRAEARELSVKWGEGR